MMEPLKLYVDPAWRRSGLHSPLMFPFWGNPTGASSLFAQEMFTSHEFDVKYYTVTDDMKSADIIFAPYRHNLMLAKDTELLDSCIRRSRESGLPLLIDGVGDIENPVRYNDAYVLRIGGYRFLPEKNRIQMPPASDDLLERCRGGELVLRPKSAGKPTIGFAAWVHLSPWQRLRTGIKELPLRFRAIQDDRYRACSKGVLWRQRAVRALQDSSRVSLRLLARNSFSGSAKTAQDDMRRLREELVETVSDSDYALDVRGDANDSTRLFEILSLGRIPVVLDTERNFPFVTKNELQRFALIIDFREVRRLADVVADFHANVSSSEYLAMQARARDAFVNYFRIDAQMQHVMQELRRLLAARDTSIPRRHSVAEESPAGTSSGTE